jgi:hypothetical protein
MTSQQPRCGFLPYSSAHQGQYSIVAMGSDEFSILFHACALFGVFAGNPASEHGFHAFWRARSHRAAALWAWLDAILHSPDALARLLLAIETD